MMFYFRVVFTFTTNGSRNRSRCCTKQLSVTMVCFILVAILPAVMSAVGGWNINGHSVPNVPVGGVAIAVGCFQMAQLNLLQINTHFLQQRHFEYCTLLTQSTMFPLTPLNEMYVEAAREKMACQLQQYTSMVTSVPILVTPVSNAANVPAPLPNVWIAVTPMMKYNGRRKSEEGDTREVYVSCNLRFMEDIMPNVGKAIHDAYQMGSHQSSYFPLPW